MRSFHVLLLILASIMPDLATGQAMDIPVCPITIEHYDAVDTGMSLDDVVEIMPCEGSVRGESQSQFVEMMTVEWSSMLPPGGITVDFTNGKVTNKRQWNLRRLARP